MERAPDDPSMLIVTYEGEHRHGQDAVAAAPETVSAINAGPLGGFVFESS